MNVYKCFRWELKPAKGGSPRYYFKFPIVIDQSILKIYGICSSIWYPEFYYIFSDVHIIQMTDTIFFNVLDQLYDYIISQYEPGGSQFSKSQKYIEELLRN